MITMKRRRTRRARLIASVVIVIALLAVSVPPQIFGYPDFSKVNRVLIIGSDDSVIEISEKDSEKVVGMLSELGINGLPLASIFNLSEDGWYTNMFEISYQNATSSQIYFGSNYIKIDDVSWFADEESMYQLTKLFFSLYKTYVK